MKNKIQNLEAREILDSRGNPTVEVVLEVNDEIYIASVPSGASTGKNEAKELRDGGRRYNGKGVLTVVKNVNNIIAPKIKGESPLNQEKIDRIMIKLDGTKNKSKLGANAILPVSMAVCRAGADLKHLPLYKYISKISGFRIRIPLACFNIINGGSHAGNDLDIQEFMIIPQKNRFSDNLQIAAEIYHNLKDILVKELGEETINIGDEGGFAPPISLTEQGLNLLEMAVKGFPKVKIGLDCAATQFFKDGKYHLDNTVFTKQGLINFYNDLIYNYPIAFLEDPFSEDDWISWKKLKPNVLLIGDDLTTTNKDRVKKAIEGDCIGGVIIKPNQIGTITEVFETLKTAKKLKIIVSHRSGETKDDFIADLAVGVGADYIKAGAPARGERLAKYNRLLRIEEQLIK